MKKYLIVLFFVASPFLFGQISVKSFKELTMDTDGRFTGKETEDGDKCALIKVVTPYKEFSFDVGHAWVCAVDETQTGEIWLWVNEDAKYLTIRHKSLGILRRYRIPKKIEPLMTYELILQTAKITEVVEESIITNFVTIDSEPAGAKVFIDGANTGKITPFSTELMLGKHSYTLEKEGYAGVSGTFLLTRKETKRITKTLKNLSAKIIFAIKPENATLKINGILKNEKTQKLLQGKYLIEISHPQYYKIKKAMVVKAEKDETKKYELLPKLGNLKINSTPYGAKIYIDGEYYGETPKVIQKLLIGERKIKLTKNGYQKQTATVKIVEAKTAQQHLKLKKGSDTSEMFYKGNDYYFGLNGVEKDYKKAVDWFRKAAEQGHVGAQYNLGYMYEYGEGVEKSRRMAKYWYQKACDNGYEYACDLLETL